ncbi:MAG: putative signal transduction histidine kinase [Frankiales bacterium]|nr:putative signal transduction histidine kinase [Frankiales bacterium]
MRRRSGRVLGGVAAGLAEHLAVPVLAVRIVFIALTLAGGSGVLAYGLFWFLLPQGEAADEPEQDESGPQALVLAVAAAVGLVLLQFAGIGSEATLPLFAAGTGIALVWRQADDVQRARFTPTRGWPALLGLVLLAGGLAGFLASRGELRAARDGLLSTAVVVGGLTLLGLPWVRQVLVDLRSERRERIRSQERADLSAQVHDSVLQTLALIQRAADDPREVARLARSQERELRTWLYRPATAHLTLEAALEQAVAEVEEDHGVRVEVVVVGDVTVDDRLAALVAAAREAVVNAAKHAEVPLVQVYAEVEARDVTLFVRDRGKGFDMALVPPDRYGLAQSVIARVERAGGDVRVRSAPGEGTEIRLSLTREASRG